MWGSLLGAGIGLAGNLLGGKSKNNPGNAGMEHLNRVPQYGYNAYNPFINRGAEAEADLYPELQRQAYQPQEWMNQATSGYEQSPGFLFKKNQLLKGANNTAAAGGFLGTENDVNSRAEMVNALLSGDMQQYFDNIFNISGRGQHGMEERVNRGYNAASSLADYLGNVEGTRGQYAGYSAGYKNQQRNNTYGALSDLIGIGANMMMGGGGGQGFNGGFMGGMR